MSDKTSLGDRMKHNYEDRARFFLPRRTHVIMRLDGKAFHSYTRELDKPYDERLARSFWVTAAAVMNNISGSQFAYHQSDEISILITDYNKIHTEAYYDNNIQKLASISASIMTAHFNKEMNSRYGLKTENHAYFDSRVFCIPDPIEVYNYFIWRQRDCIRNSIQGLGQLYFSQRELHELNTDQVQEKLFQEKNINWSDQENWKKNGVFIYPDGGTYHPSGTIGQESEWFMGMIPRRQD